jgi:hypothetical protein
VTYISTTEDDKKRFAAACLAGIAVAQNQIGESGIADDTMQRALRLARRIGRKEDLSRALQEISVEQARVGDLAGVRTSLEEITEESARRFAQKDIAQAQARAGSREEAVRTIDAGLIERGKLIEELANVFSELGDREGLKLLLQASARETASAYHLCVLLAKNYPGQLAAVAAKMIDAEPA